MIDGYDIGGAEWPIDPERYLVIDWANPNQVWPERDEYGKDVEWARCNFDIGDVNVLDLPPVGQIYVGRLLRYVRREGQLRLAQWVYDHLVVGGVLTILDDCLSMLPFLEAVEYRMRITDCYIVNPSEGNTKADWQFTLTRRR